MAVLTDSLLPDAASTVDSDQPGVQVYTGNWLAGSPLNKAGRPYEDYDGVAIECQDFPDAPNRETFPNTFLRPAKNICAA